MPTKNPLASFLKAVKDWTQTNARKAISVSIPHENTDSEKQVAPLKPNQSYFRIHLADLSLGGESKEWIEERGLAVQTVVRLDYAGKNGVLLDRLSGIPTSIARDPSATVNYELSKLMPFRGGKVELACGLLAFSGSTGHEFIESADSVEYLRDAAAGSVHIGMHHTFADKGGQSQLQPGYHAVILADPRQLNPKHLFVRNQRLFYSPRPGDEPEPLREHDYLLFHIEGREERDDWRLGYIQDSCERAMRAILRGNTEQASLYKTKALASAIESPDLTIRDQGRLAFAINEELESLEVNRHNAVGDEERDLNQIMVARARPRAQGATLRKMLRDELMKVEPGSMLLTEKYDIIGQVIGAIDDQASVDQPISRADSETEANASAAAPPQYKRINAWVSEQEAEPEKPLALDTTYHLNFNIGAPVAGSILTTPSANIAESDIPEEGLETTWVVTTESVELAQSETDKGVKVEQTDSPAGWKAGFTLFIPKGGSSETRQLLITPHQAEAAELNIFIFARDTLYRQFRVNLNVAAQEAPPEEKKSSVTISGEVIHTPATHTGLQPQHEWQTPPGTLKIIVQGQKSVYVHGKIGSNKEVETPTNWNANDKQVNGSIENIRLSAEAFRTKFSKQLNEIEPQDLETRLAAFRASPWEHWRDDESLQVCDAPHQQVWDNEIKSSKELYELAYHGYMLYSTFFPDKATHPLRGWLDSLLPAWRVNISWLAEMDENWIASVPWGLLYTQEVKPGVIIDPMNFWGLRFRLEYKAHAIDNPMMSALGTLGETRHAYGFYWGNETEIAEEVVWQQSEWAKWHNKIFVPDSSNPAATFKEQLVDLLSKPGQMSPAAFYFFCHCSVGNGNKPVLRFGNTNDDEDNLRPIDWGAASFTNQPVVFINACTSAGADPSLSNALEETFFKQGCRAYLGTEIKVPIRLASRFAKIFYGFFYRTMDEQAKPVAAGEAVFQARRFLWREYRNLGGLFYTYINNFELYMASKKEVDAMHTHS